MKLSLSAECLSKQGRYRGLNPTGWGMPMSRILPEELALADCENEAVSGALEGGVRELAADREASFEQVFECYRAMVFNLTYRILGDREEALDVSQEVFLSVYRKLGRFRWEASLKTWIYRIAVNRASNRCRWWNRLRRRGTVSLDEHLNEKRNGGHDAALAAKDISPENAVLAHERSSEIQRALIRLPVDQRVAVVMRDIEGMSYDEISSMLHVSLGTVKSRIARGRDELKRRLNGVLS
jgi:RNA polymerase sigma-70 factor (ECF subfamily)